MLLLCFIARQALAAPPATTTGKVVSVHDGDTLTLRTDDGQTLKVRLRGIDAPEIRQPVARRSRRHPLTGWPPPPCGVILGGCCSNDRRHLSLQTP